MHLTGDRVETLPNPQKMRFAVPHQHQFAGDNPHLAVRANGHFSRP